MFIIQTQVLVLIGVLGFLGILVGGIGLFTDDPSNFERLLSAWKEDRKHKREMEVKAIEAKTSLTRAQLGDGS